MDKKHLLLLADTLGNHHGWTPQTVGTYAVNDSRIFVRMQGVGSCTLRTAAKAAQWFSDNWPADLPWPTDVPRPAKSHTEDAA